MLAQLLYRAIELRNYKPTDIWDRLSYSAQLKYCEVMVEKGDYTNLPMDVFGLYITYLPAGEKLGKKVMEDLINN